MSVESQLFEICRYTDGWLHFYRSDDLDSDREFVTPACAEVDPFYGVDHERRLTTRTARGEFHPACLAAPTLGPDIPAPRRPASPEDTLVLPVPVGAFRGRL